MEKGAVQERIQRVDARAITIRLAPRRLNDIAKIGGHTFPSLGRFDAKPGGKLLGQGDRHVPHDTKFVFSCSFVNLVGRRLSGVALRRGRQTHDFGLVALVIGPGDEERQGVDAGLD